MKKITLYILVTILLGGVCSCLDDKNDYNYKQINELKNPSNFTNFNSSYSVGVEEDLKLEPKFRFSIDSINPDVSYEWMLNDKLLEAKTPTYTFNSSRGGLFELTFSVIDNKTGVKFSVSTNILVRSPYQRGWVILTEVDGKSTLSFIRSKTLYNVAEITNKWEEKVMRDSMVYHYVEKNLIQNLGTNPKGIMEHLGYPSAFGKADPVYDELVIMQDRWVELNGNTLGHEVYTDEEFGGDLPKGGFKPVDASMSFSAKFIRDEDGYIYIHQKPLANDFHAGAYMPVPLWNSTKFSALYPAQKYRDNYMEAVLACREKDNSLVIIRDRGALNNSSDPTLNSFTTGDLGDVFDLTGDNASKFQNMKDNQIVTLMPANINKGDIKQAWVALMKEPNSSVYQLRYFRIEGKKTEIIDYIENNNGNLGGESYTDMAVFQHKKFVVIATGNKLWYWQYADVIWDNFTFLSSTTPILLHEFDKNIASISSNDINLNLMYGVYNGQLGVALEDGSFWIYEIQEQNKNASGIVEKPVMKKIYPNKETGEDNNFGKIIDTLYKIGNANQIFWFDL